MCGILVYLGKETLSKNHQSITSITHRGPNASGIYSTEVANKVLTLGHTRLSIIDLSVGANQPMQYNGSEWWIVFNGEIYNYVEIKNELIQLGYKFYTESDTEVLLAAFINWGESCLDMFNGMFSFVIWNENKKELFIARDRYGVKPLYYINNAQSLCFVSELKQFKHIPGFKNKINYNSVYQFLEFGDFSFDRNTIWDGVKELEPGHFTRLILNKWKLGQEINQKIWYDIFAKNERKELTESEAIEKYNYLLDDSINLRLRSDVPIGFALSGGLDSSAIVAWSAQKIGQLKSMKTFTVYSKEYDERKYANQLIDELNIESNFIEVNSGFIQDNIENIIYNHDLPATRMTILAHYQLCKLCKDNGITVILEGQGPDEVLAGYEPFLYTSLIEKLSNLNIIDFFKDFRAINTNLGHSYITDLKRLYAYLMPKYISQKRRIKKSNLFFNSNHFKDTSVNFLGECYKDEASVLMQHIVRMKQLRSILHNVDRVGMGNSIEIRNPFLDYRIMEFSLALPTSLKIKNGYTKYLLRESMKDILPQNITMRTDKMGFTTPEAAYMKGPIRELFLNEIENIERIPFINQQSIKKEFDLFLNGKKRYDRRFWRFMSYSIWSRLNNVSYG